MSNTAKMVAVAHLVASTTFTLNIAHAALPTTAPSPLEAFIKVNKTFEHNDADAYAKLQKPGTADEQAYHASLAKLLTSQGKLLAAYKSKIDPDAKSPVPASLLIINAMPAAHVRDAVIAMMGDDTAETTNPSSPVRYRYKRVNGIWEMDLAGTMSLAFPSDPARGTTACTQMFNEYADAFDAIVGEINAGTLSTRQAVIETADKRLKAIQEKMATILPPFVPVQSGRTLGAEQFEERREHPTPEFKSSFDPAVSLTSRPSLCISSATPSPLKSGERYCGVDVTAFRGKRVRFWAFLRSENVVNWAGIGGVVINATGKFVAFDIPSNRFLRGDDRHISGTSDWKKVATVFDVPPDAARLFVGVQLTGPGKVWMDDARIEAVAADVPTTDDQNIHLWSNYASAYEIALDSSVQRNGNSTVRIASMNPPPDARGEYVYWNRVPDKYRGRPICLSMWIKTENLAKGGGLRIAQARPKKPDQQIDSEKGTRPIIGTTDWTRYEAMAEVADDADCVQFGIGFSGGGKIWIDDIKIEDLDVNKGL